MSITRWAYSASTYTLTDSAPRTKTGEICLDVLKEQWSPVWTLSAACLAVQALLAAPEPSSPLNVDAGELFLLGRGRTMS